MRRIVQVLIAATLFVLGWVFPVWANIYWEPQDKHPTPSVYAGREYTRQHWVEYQVDEAGSPPHAPVNGQPWTIFSGRSSVFDVPGDYTAGYTAIGDNDEVAWRAAAYLDALGVPLVDGYWIVSPSYWADHSVAGIPSPVVPDKRSEMKQDVPVVNTVDGSGLDQGDTLDDPKCFRNDQTGFAAGGYQIWNGGSRPHKWSSEASNSPGYITKDYASYLGYASLSGTGYTTRAKIVFSYLYGLTVSPGSLTAVGSPGSDGKQAWQVTVLNTTPYIAKDVHLRAYLVQNGKYTLAADTTTDIGPRPQGNGQGGIMRPAASWNLGSGVAQDGVYTNQVKWTFEMPVPSGDYKVLVSANVSFNESGSASTEPLKTVVAYGHNYTSVPGLTGTKMEVAPFVETPGNSAPGGNRAYIDNYALSGQQSGWQPPAPGGGGSNDYPSNLAVIGLALLDSNGNPVSGTVKVNEPYKVKATFNSSFDFGGWAKVRFYVKREAGWMELKKEENFYFEPNGTIERIWDWTGMSEQVTLIATVAYRWWDQQSQYVSEPFEGKTLA